MTLKERAAMQQALEWFAWWRSGKALWTDAPCAAEDVLSALREALAEQAEQEPVGYFAYDEEHDIWEELTGPNAPGATPLYAAPGRTKDLTDDEIMKINVDTAGIVPTCDRQFHFARAVIQEYRRKNGIV